MMKSKTDIEEQLRRAILHAGISRYALAHQSGVSEGVISNFMSRKRTVTLETAAKLAAVLELTLTPAKRAGKGR